MNVNNLLIKNTKYMYNLSLVIQKNRGSGWRNIRVAAKTVLLIDDALCKISRFYIDMLSLMMTIDGYNLVVSLIVDQEKENFQLPEEYLYNDVKETLGRVIKELCGLGFNFDGMEHLVYNCFLLEKYEFVTQTEHSFIIYMMLNALKKTQLSVRNVLNKVSDFLDRNEKYIQLIRNNQHLLTILTTLIYEKNNAESNEMTDRELRHTFINASLTSIEGHEYSIIDVLQRISDDISCLVY
jgi:hypothetical protein